MTIVQNFRPESSRVVKKHETRVIRLITTLELTDKEGGSSNDRSSPGFRTKTCLSPRINILKSAKPKKQYFSLFKVFLSSRLT
ncbi:unnamed protein product [Clavelina lepadiformis]|uniref:Uncharacterized protein n=1 Tax=Clavelina lepadiformis TaxID=159417 RepID=A0ABP0G0F8_CLALP